MRCVCVYFCLCIVWINDKYTCSTSKSTRICIVKIHVNVLCCCCCFRLPERCSISYEFLDFHFAVCFFPHFHFSVCVASFGEKVRWQLGLIRAREC